MSTESKGIEEVMVNIGLGNLENIFHKNVYNTCVIFDMNLVIDARRNIRKLPHPGVLRLGIINSFRILFPNSLRNKLLDHE